LGAAAVAALVLFFGVLALPESPRLLIKSGKIDEAKQVLSYIRKPTEIDHEIKSIQDTAKQETNALASTTWGTLFTSRYRYLVVAGLGVAAFQQFQGANAIFYYIPLIVEKATGHAASEALMWPIIKDVLLVLASLLYIWIAEKFNRRTL